MPFKLAKTLILKLYSYLSKHVSFIMMATGVGALLIVNLALKDVLNDFAYGKYSLFITYVSLIGSFGLLGLDQVFLRTSAYEEGILYVSKKLLKTSLFISLLSSLLFSLLFKWLYLNEIPYLLLLGVSFFSILIIGLYNLFRLQARFFISQTVNNLWKILFFVTFIIVFYVLNYKISLLFLAIVFLVTRIVTLFFSFILISKKQIKVKYLEIENANLFKLSSGFFLSLLIMSFLNFGDRFLIEHKVGVVELGNYFFLASLFLFPFSFIQGYIGFKELIIFKQNYSLLLLKKKLRHTMIYGFTFAFFLAFCFYLVDYLKIYTINFNENFILILILLFSGIIRLCYSSFSAAIGAVIREENIIRLNWISLIFILLLTLLYFIISLTLYQLLLLFMASWLFRIFVFYYFLSKQEDETNA